MIPADRMNDALQAIQMLVAQARHAAFEAGAKGVGSLLDDIEALPALMHDEIDQNHDFELALQDIAQKHPQCRFIVEQFLDRPVGR